MICQNTKSVNKMNKMNIVIDVDSTTIDTIQLACDYYCEIYMDHPDFKKPVAEKVYKWNFEDEMPLFTLQDLDRMFQSKYFFDNVNYFDNAIEVINKLNEDERFNVCFCSIGSSSNISRKSKFLEKTFPTIEQVMLVRPEHVVMCKKIVNMNHTENEPFIFLDDNKDNLIGSNAKYKILYTQFGDNKREWNKDWEGMFATNWNDLYELINSIYDYEFRIDDKI